MTEDEIKLFAMIRIFDNETFNDSLKLDFDCSVEELICLLRKITNGKSFNSQLK